jgi:hypothetical protein
MGRSDPHTILTDKSRGSWWHGVLYFFFRQLEHSAKGRHCDWELAMTAMMQRWLMQREKGQVVRID